MRLLKTAIMLGVLVAAAPLGQAAEPAMVAGCSGFRFDLDHELKLFATDPQKIDVSSGPARIEGETLYAALLKPQADVHFKVAPEKLMVADGSYAGLFQIDAGRFARLRVTLSEAAWVDVIDDDGRPLQSVQHTGSHDCKLLRKSVEFAIEPGRPIIQISGSTVQEIRLAVSVPAS